MLQPPASSQRMGMAMDLVKNKPELIAENVFLRQQVIILKRQVKQLKISARERGLCVQLVSGLRSWQDALLIMKPDTLLN